MFLILHFTRDRFKNVGKEIVIEGNAVQFRGVQKHYQGKLQAEIEFAGALKNDQVLTILGSSELTATPWAPYHYFPDSLGIPVVAFGHAYHQMFSMFCELLTMKDYLEDSKIAILISPGWFATEGTNIEAFLQFVRPNFLNAIVADHDIPGKYKRYMGRYVSENIADIESPSKSLLFLAEMYGWEVPIFSEYVYDIKSSRLDRVRFDVTADSTFVLSTVNVNWDSIGAALQQTFVSGITSNNMYVYDEYYKNYIIGDDGKEKWGDAKEITLSTNTEFQDFLMLIDLLKTYKCKASFVIQAMNPYYYRDLENYSEAISDMKRIMDENGFPYLDMYVTNKADYEPATLMDVMHLGDYGWIRINDFLTDTYYGDLEK